MRHPRQVSPAAPRHVVDPTDPRAPDDATWALLTEAERRAREEERRAREEAEKRVVELEARLARRNGSSGGS